MDALGKIIRNAYQLFAPYTLGTSLDVCKACCVTDEEERLLLTTPLADTTSDMLWRGYFESARTNGGRELWEMKHFLPRVLEVVADFDFPCHSTEIAFLRLDFDQTDQWPPAERQLLEAYALAFFERCLGSYPLPSGDALADILIMFGLAHFDLRPLLRAWTATDTPASVAHFVHLLRDDIYYGPQGPVTLQNPFSKPIVDEQLAAWLADPAGRATWAARLEKARLYQSLPDEEAIRLSLAHEVLTAELG